jgi:hypothetical protein
MVEVRNKICQVNFAPQWEGSACTQSALIFFLLSFGGWRIFFIFFIVPNMFPSSSQWAPNLFPRLPMCSQRVFSIARHFNPICFAQSLPLLTYLGGPKGEPLHLSIESSILRSLHSFDFFLQLVNQIGSFHKKKKKLDF